MTRPAHIFIIILTKCKHFRTKPTEQVILMHELGVLRHAVRTVSRIAAQNQIQRVKHITLEVGTESTFVPAYLEKLFPVAIDQIPVMKDAQLRIRMVSGRSLVIGEIGY